MTKEKPPEKKGIFLGLSVKLIVGFTLIFTIVFAVAYYWFYSFATETAVNRVRDDLTGTLEGATHGVDGDEFLSLVEDLGEDFKDKGEFPEDERYWKHVEWLGVVHDIEPRAWAYTFVGDEDASKLWFVGSVASARIGPDDEEIGTWGAEFMYFCDPVDCGGGATNLSAITGNKIVLQDVNCDQWGCWISGYIPIKNLNGDVVGGLGIDFEAEYVKEVQQGILNSIVISFIVTYSVLFILVFIVARAFTRPVRELTRVAELIGEARYAEADLGGLLNATLKDEITTLAEVFEEMVKKVYKREIDLKKQVAELRIEIDEVKARKQVEEIIDTDFFDELQEKVRDIRARKRKDD